MPRVLALSIPFVLVAVFVPAAAHIPHDGGKQEYYFPTRVGTKWVYVVKGGEGYGSVVTESKEKNGRYLVTVKTTGVDFKDRDSTVVDQYEVSKEGVFLVAEGLEEPNSRIVHDPPTCLLKLPYNEGEKWYEKPTSAIDLSPYIAGRVETIKVPAGTFAAIRVDSGTGYSCWWAPGAGTIRYRNDGTDTVMKSFTLPEE